jgi:hypothetical protein
MLVALTSSSCWTMCRGKFRRMAIAHISKTSEACGGYLWRRNMSRLTVDNKGVSIQSYFCLFAQHPCLGR